MSELRNVSTEDSRVTVMSELSTEDSRVTVMSELRKVSTEFRVNSHV